MINLTGNDIGHIFASTVIGVAGAAFVISLGAQFVGPFLAMGGVITFAGLMYIRWVFHPFIQQ
jgi:hypothetical protein